MLFQYYEILFMSDNNKIIELKNVKKYYRLGKSNIVKAVNGVSLEVEEGEFIAVYGPSGCGKSTLMHVMGLLDMPTKGNVFINGSKVDELSDDELTHLRSENIGFVFQFFFLTPNLTALENVELPMIFAGEEDGDRKERARKLLKNVGLGERCDHLPGQLSGGQRQRVAIARALANNPKIIFADEPTGNLDSKTGKEVVKLFKKLWNNSNTLIVVTHDPKIARQAPRVIKMLDGKVISDGEYEVKTGSSYIG